MSEELIDELSKTYGFAGDGKEVPPGATEQTMRDLYVGTLKDELEPMKQTKAWIW